MEPDTQEDGPMTIAMLLAVMAAQPVPPNMELAEEALEIACDPIADTVSAMGLSEVLIEMSGEHQGEWFALQTLTRIMDDRGLTVIDKESDSTLTAVRVRPMEIAVEYGDVSRPWVVGARRVDRMARCELSASVVAPDGEVLATLRTSGTAEDRVSWSDAETLTGSTDWDWLAAELPEGGGGGILEPVIVTGVVASLIYLFYSSRAD